MSEGRSAWARYRGRPVDVRPGESLAAWWGRRGVAIVQRSIRYHRPRAPFCGIGHCTNCLVRVNGRPNVRACRYRPVPGDRIETENAWPSPTFDILGALDPIFARGLDTLHGFTRPAFARPLYHRVVRGLAGFGSIADAPSPVRPGLRFEADHLVLGAGTSGRAAVERLASGGGTGLWLDRGEVPNAPGGFRTLPRTTALFLPPPTGPAERPFRLLAASEDHVGVEIRARDVVVAVGGYDASLLFPGNDRPGVLTGDGALALAPDPTAPGFRRA
ncbi:MAG TPA: (2Fe-2S)-binding protein, partial [Thermoplasmata archaeon]|nr:(2Fe-2S)-binding protein [Thermoplasmata archaeon]